MKNIDAADKITEFKIFEIAVKISVLLTICFRL